MGNVATTPVLTGFAGDSGVSPASLGKVINRGSATERWTHIKASPSGNPTDVWALELFGPEGTVHVKAAFVPSGDGTHWTAATIAVHSEAVGASVERLNKIVRRMTTSSGHAPRLDLYWRTGKTAVRCPGYAGRTSVPVMIRGTYGAGWLWDLATFGGKLIAPGKPRKTSPKVSPAVSTPTPTPSVVSPTPAPTPSVVSEPTEPKAPLSTDTRSGRKAARRAAAAEQRQVVSTPVEPKARQAEATGTKSPVIFSDPKTIKPGFAVHHDPTMVADLQREAKLHAAGDRTVVLLSGPTGTGKTLTAKYVAETEGLPFLKVDCAAMATFADWVGAVSLKEGHEGGVVTEFAPSLLLEAIRADGPWGGIRRMVLLDEANRVPQGQALGAVMPMLDGQGTIYVPDAQQSIPVDPAVLWVLTANIGSAYSGTVSIDAAIMNRVTSNIEVKYPTPAAEQQMLVEQGRCTPVIASHLVKVAAQVRASADQGKIASPAVSTRQLIEAARKCSVGASPIHACELAFANAYSAEGGVDSERAVVMVAVNAVLAGVTK